MSIPSLRGATRRSNPDFFVNENMDCFASLAMTAPSSRRKLVVHGIAGIAGDIAAIEGGPVIGRQRETGLQPARQIGIGNEDAAEGDGVRVPFRNRGPPRLRR